MDLWVRSQNKKCLLKASMFNLDNDETGIYCYSNEENFCLLGKYATKERALEVLDEIQTQLVTLNYQYLHRGEHFIATESNVYEMPKE